MNSTILEKLPLIFFPFTLFSLTMSCTLGCINSKPKLPKSEKSNIEKPKSDVMPPKEFSFIDTADYNKRMLALSNKDTSGNWPVESTYPLDGAILPFHRIVAYYGNLYSQRMGILGELPKSEMLKRLNDEVSKWQAADPSTKPIPALHYIAATAQILSGREGLYRMQMPFSQIDTILAWGESINALIFLDVQVGHSNIENEVKRLEPYLKLPHVHLGIDPEYSMKNGEIPGTKIGFFDASDINDATYILKELVQKHDLPPKVLVVHRFTQGMVKDAKEIIKVPEVQIVMSMDGFGDKISKTSSYKYSIYRDPVQFTGFKIFYKNDQRNNAEICTPEEILEFTPKPSFILYQ